MDKILRKTRESHKTRFPKLGVFVGQESIFGHYCIQNVEDGIQNRVYKIDKESVTHFSQFVSVTVKKILRKSQTQFQEKLRKLRLWKNYGFVIKRMCNYDVINLYVSKSIIFPHVFEISQWFESKVCKSLLSFF